MSAVAGKVAEARPRDVGRGLVRVDPSDLEALGVGIGDVVWLEGARRTPAKAMPAFPDQRGRGLVYIDGLLRRNAGASVGEGIALSAATAAPAAHVRLQPLGRTPTARDLPFLGQRLAGVPLVAGDEVEVALVGGASLGFRVVATQPEGPVVVGAATRVELAEAGAVDAAPPRRSWEDIGGLGPQLDRIREMIELPLRHPELFERLGVSAPRGVLMHGPPGCGKTLIARTIAEEADASFFVVRGPEVIHKNYGESEKHLRKLFDDAAKKAPSVIFLDEVDALAPRRSEVQGEVEKRVVATLLSLMDGLDGRGEVVVIAATNLPDHIDPALRRPGRFDREIAIPVPDRPGRLEILEVHTRGMPLATDVDLDRLASLTHGYVGADLGALCREAAMKRLRTVLPQLDLQAPTLTGEALWSLEVGMADFLAAHAEIEPSAIREVFVDVPDVRWSQVGGLDSVRDLLLEAVEWPLQHGALFQAAGLSPAKGVLLHGPPGTGKTLLAKALATESQANFILVKGPELLSRYVGDAERSLREVFRKARQAAPCILFFDEVDGLAPRRGDGGSDGGVSERVLTQFLTELDSVEPLAGVLVLAATNRLDRLDPAALRPGRFDEIVEIPRPDPEGCRAILEVHLRGRPTESLDIEALSAQLVGCSGAEIADVVRRAAMAAVRRAVAASAAPEAVCIGAGDLVDAIDAVLMAGRPA